MSRKTCFMIFIAAVTIILVSYVIKFSPVTGAVSSVFAAMQNPYLAASAVVVSLLLAKQRYYWLLILGCSRSSDTVFCRWRSPRCSGIAV